MPGDEGDGALLGGDRQCAEIHGNPGESVGAPMPGR
jgi:hypothetical protein